MDKGCEEILRQDKYLNNSRKLKKGSSDLKSKKINSFKKVSYLKNQKLRKSTLLKKWHQFEQLQLHRQGLSHHYYVQLVSNSLNLVHIEGAPICAPLSFINHCLLKIELIISQLIKSVVKTSYKPGTNILVVK